MKDATNKKVMNVELYGGLDAPERRSRLTSAPNAAYTRTTKKGA